MELSAPIPRLKSQVRSLSRSEGISQIHRSNDATVEPIPGLANTSTWVGGTARG